MKKLLVASFLTFGIILISGCSLTEQKPVDNSTMTEQSTVQKQNTKTSFQENESNNIVYQKEICMDDFQKQEIPSEPYQKYTLSKVELDNFKNIIGIESFCISKKLGQPFLNVDWNSKQSNTSFQADSGRMISIGFRNLFKELGGWGDGYLLYSTYDFSIGSEYDTYASKSDYQSVKNDSKNNIIEINGSKSFIQYKWHNRFEKIQKIIVFPFENYYIAIVYMLSGDYTTNHDQIISELYNEKYPKEEKEILESIDSFTKSIKFKNQ